MTNMNFESVPFIMSMSFIIDDLFKEANSAIVKFISADRFSPSSLAEFAGARLAQVSLVSASLPFQNPTLKANSTLMPDFPFKCQF